ncbi:Acyl-CoA reductase [Tropicibacter naphthalenivorans]|uniref:aldehyde dehydrogenase (NAD(+)) n=1 Tax=Tropicibacter naphthalenivorans TaxID=441103 RepID=A0A0P1H0A0_9RHOB|nr:Phenylacetaldehyde dehydrogenase [Tropicibacter naphthalenivorans]SMD04697.1 Acyl-CoA reductase [Tropicibacter naphthalenivorans]
MRHFKAGARLAVDVAQHAAAQRAFETWLQKSDAKLHAACEAVTAKIGEHAEELAQLLTAEQGKPLVGMGSRFELGGAQAWAGYTAGLSLPMKVLQDNNEGRIELHRKPVGVVGSITPWNWPVMIAVWHILPAGVVNIVTSDDGAVNIGGAMSTHPGIRKMVFTGSTATGKKVMSGAAETMKRLTLELGGNDAGIVLPDVDAAEIAEGLFWGGFINNGQTCAAMKRLYVHADVYEDVCAALTDYAKNVPVGLGSDENAILGPVANQMQFDKVKSLVDAAKTKSRVLLGGEAGEGLFFPPTLIADLSADDPLVAEEQFGPALPIIKYTDVEDAIAQANASENGLGGSVWSKDIEKAKGIARRLECGSVWINRHGTIQPNAPFGGVKSSGFGVEFGEEGLAEYTDIQVMHI